jgi:hypothetical protein
MSPLPFEIYATQTGENFTTDSANHRLNMDLDIQSLFGLLCTALFLG